jgi:hypothetical protein
MRHIVSCDGPVQCKQLVTVKLRQLLGFVRKICCCHFICIAIYKQAYHIVAQTMHFASVTFRIMVLIGCRRKLIWDVRKHNAHTPLLSRSQWDWAEWLSLLFKTYSGPINEPVQIRQLSPSYQVSLRLVQALKCYRGGQRIYRQHGNNITTKLRSFSPQAYYTYRATAACRRRQCQLLRIEGVAWSAQRIPTAVNLDLLKPEPLLFHSSSSSVILTRLSGPRSRSTSS